MAAYLGVKQSALMKSDNFQEASFRKQVSCCDAGTWRWREKQACPTRRFYVLYPFLFGIFFFLQPENTKKPSDIWIISV